MNLIQDKMITVMTKTGEHLLISPSDITKSNLLSIDSGRADHDIAYTEFLIGILQTTMAPASDEEWRELYNNPPSKSHLQAVFDPISKFFSIDDEKLRFKQLSPDGKSNPIFNLFIEGPGEITVKDGRDFLEKSSRVQKVCPSCAVGALMVRQIYTGVGGSARVMGEDGQRLKGYGYSAAFRQGNRLATCVLQGSSLWQTLWLNVTNQKDLEGDYKSNPYPWNGATPGEHPCWGFWETAWSTWLNFEKEETFCDCCGEACSTVVRTYNKTHSKGALIEYRHPLTVDTTGLGGINAIVYPRCLVLLQEKVEKKTKTEGTKGKKHKAAKPCLALLVAQRRQVAGQVKIFCMKMDQATYVGMQEITFDLPLNLPEVAQWASSIQKLGEEVGGLFGRKYGKSQEWTFLEEFIHGIAEPFKDLLKTGDKEAFLSIVSNEINRLSQTYGFQWWMKEDLEKSLKKFRKALGCSSSVAPVSKSKTKKKPTVLRGGIALSWWGKLKSKWKNADRAELRRCTTLKDIKDPKARKAFEQLWQGYNDAAVEDFGKSGLEEWQTKNITVLAVALAHIKQTCTEPFLKTVNRFGISIVREGQVDLNGVLKVIQRADHTVNVASLANEIYHWSPAKSAKWRV